jgi:hypothetical protein
MEEKTIITIASIAIAITIAIATITIAIATITMKEFSEIKFSFSGIFIYSILLPI